MTTLVVYPDASPESTTVDGYARRVGVNETFATIRAGAGNGSADSSASAYAGAMIATTTSNQYSQLLRGLFLFDTSSIPSAATISSRVLSLYGTGKANGLGSPDLDVVSSNPASNTAITGTDYSTLGTSVYGSVTSAGFSTSGYNDITLSDGVTKNGITKLGTRLSWDTDNSFGGTWVSSASTTFTVNNADSASNDPVLTVVYTSGVDAAVAVVQSLGLVVAGSALIDLVGVVRSLQSLGLPADVVAGIQIAAAAQVVDSLGLPVSAVGLVDVVGVVGGPLQSLGGVLDAAGVISVGLVADVGSTFSMGVPLGVVLRYGSGLYVSYVYTVGLTLGVEAGVFDVEVYER